MAPETAHEAPDYTTFPEALPRNPAEGLQYENAAEGLRPVQAEKILAPNGALWDGKEVVPVVDGHLLEKGQKRRRICGLPGWLFSTLAAIVLAAIIAAAVAGGVFGSRHGGSSSSSTAASSTASTSATPITTIVTSSAQLSMTTSSATSSSSASSSVSITTSEIPGPSGTTLLRDCPSSNNTIYTFGSASSPLLFRKVCSAEFNDINGYASAPNTPAESLDACIQLCASYNIQNQTEIQAGTSNVCNAVSWRYANTDDFLGQCFGYTTRNVSGTFDGSYSDHSDSAAWINQ